MFSTPDPIWPVIVLAVVIGSDALMSIRPPRFIRDCYAGVGFPLEWGWALVYVKLLATAGLIVGIWHDGVGVAATAGVVAYFVAATIAHLRARFLGSEFWLNCLGMLALSLAVLAWSFAF
ncbi:DoxX family protein [Gordonia sp. HY002]|uniref:DoxX family protein n=1 Tax=Gordonia zhenghanii TaxID=2911516 RepID=UPI001EF006A8|nr:DoxX family protein [Gordonia zhenghanii]MCF8569588.1 DoxX family protein [Gordonia zhenghanii]MCF8602891.1 DoxX family protein [Gordonia zhenghanii]